MLVHCFMMSIILRLFMLEVRAGIEPAYKGFADPCLTTWLPDHTDTQVYQRDFQRVHCRYATPSPKNVHKEDRRRVWRAGHDVAEGAAYHHKISLVDLGI